MSSFFLQKIPVFKKLRLSSIKIIEVVFHISSTRFDTMLHTKKQLPSLPKTKIKVVLVGVVRCGPQITFSLPTQVEVELGCDNFRMH
jgi:hypothetical protein